MSYTVDQETRWKSWASLAGLEPSIGKCFSSRNWLQINSENFLREGDEFVKAPYINFSLCSPLKSKGCEARQWTELGAAAREFTDAGGCDMAERDRLMSVFIRRQHRLLSYVPNRVSWFLPIYLGGLGLPLTLSKMTPDWRPRPGICSHEQLRVATHLRGLLEDGKEKVMRIALPASQPGFLAKAMEDMSEFALPTGERLGDVTLETWMELQEAKATMGPFLWRAWAEAPTSALEVRNPLLEATGFGRYPGESQGAYMDRLQKFTSFSIQKRFNRFWKDSKKCGFVRSLEELLVYEPPLCEVPGYVTEALSPQCDFFPDFVATFAERWDIRRILGPARNL